MAADESALRLAFAAELVREVAILVLIYLVGLYCLVSVTLNGFDVPVPEPEATRTVHK